MEQRLFVLAEIGEKINYILQITLGLDGFIDIVAAAFESVAASGILNDFTLFHRFHKPMVNAQGHAVAVGEL